MALVDIGLPDMDGWEVARRLRSGRSGGAPFGVAVTGFGDEEARDRSAMAGADVHLVKPVDLDLLRDLLSRLRRSRFAAAA